MYYSQSFCNIFISIAIPSAPNNLTITNNTDQSVSLSWSAPNDTGGCNIENYIITVTSLDGNNPWNITTTDNTTRYTITELMFGQSYNFTVRANNSIGLGEESNTINVTLPDTGLLFSSQQLSASLYNFIVQIVTIDNTIVSTRIVTSTFTSPTPVTPTSSSSKKYYCNNNFVCTNYYVYVNFDLCFLPWLCLFLFNF